MNNSLARMLHEPLLHFLLLAGLLFLAQALFQRDDREPIRVDASTQAFLIGQEADLRLRALSAAEREQLINDWIDDEILIREARKRGFDNASRVRRLLVQNMRFFLAEDPVTPDEAELRAWFESHPERFGRPETLTLDNLFFADPATAPPDLLARLTDGARPGTVGDDTGLTEKRLYDLNQRRLAAYFGPQGAPQVLAIADHRWHGPIPSPRGVHYLRVAERKPASQPAFEAARRWVEADWRLSQQRKTIEQALSEMRRGYQIILDPLDDIPPPAPSAAAVPAAAVAEPAAPVAEAATRSAVEPSGDARAIE